jgi:RimJ/RimL family protein N-acetyltransferase
MRSPTDQRLGAVEPAGRKMKILDTKRLVLRHPIHADLEDWYALYCEPELIRYIPDAPRSYEQAQKELEWFLNGHRNHPELGLWATTLQGTGKFIGRCGLLPWTIDGQAETEVAYALSQAYWGQGLATEAAKAILGYGFEQLHLPRLICLIDPANAASQRVAEKIGMTLEKELEGIDGDGIPTLIFSAANPALSNEG